MKTKIQTPLNDLEIVIITYNRDEKLNDTLSSLLNPISPVKDCKITVLNNNSTDNTKFILDNYSKKFQNFSFVSHKKNIGGNANLIRAFEIATKKYIWCLSDDDSYDWTSWSDIEKAIINDYDAILTTRTNLSRTTGIGGILMEACFCPGCIYKTKFINSDILQEMYANIDNLLPHLVISMNICLNHGRFHIPNQAIVTQPPKLEDIPEYARQNMERGISSHITGATVNRFWEAGFIKMISHLPKKIKDEIYNDLIILYGSRENYIKFLLDYHESTTFVTQNLLDIYCNLPYELQKIFITFLFQRLHEKKIVLPPENADIWNMLLAERISESKKHNMRKKAKKKIRLFFLRCAKRFE